MPAVSSRSTIDDFEARYAELNKELSLCQEHYSKIIEIYRPHCIQEVPEADREIHLQGYLNEMKEVALKVSSLSLEIIQIDKSACEKKLLNYHYDRCLEELKKKIKLLNNVAVSFTAFFMGEFKKSDWCIDIIRYPEFMIGSFIEKLEKMP